MLSHPSVVRSSSWQARLVRDEDEEDEEDEEEEAEEEDRTTDPSPPTVKINITKRTNTGKTKPKNSASSTRIFVSFVGMIVCFYLFFIPENFRDKLRC